MKKPLPAIGTQGSAKVALLALLVSVSLALSACGKIESKTNDPAPPAAVTGDDANQGKGHEGTDPSGVEAGAGEGGQSQAPGKTEQGEGAEPQAPTVNTPEEPKREPEAPAPKPEEPPKKEDQPKKPETPAPKPEEPPKKTEPPKKPETPVTKPEEPKKPETPEKKDEDDKKATASERTPEWVYRAAVWRRVRDNRAWTDTVLRIVRKRLDDFEQARDKEDFCPGYSKATRHQKEVCWLRLIGALVMFESSFNPREAFQEPDGAWSVGLMALSPGECSEAMTVKDLQNPIKNLTCGVNKMAFFISRHGFINGPKSARGAAAYWSVLRDPYVYGKYKLGRRRRILKITHAYRSMPGDPHAVVVRKTAKKDEGKSSKK